MTRIMGGSFKTQQPESDGDLLKRLGADGHAWAAEICRRNPTLDDETMRAWFCNAIEAGRANGRESAQLSDALKKEEPVKPVPFDIQICIGKHSTEVCAGFHLSANGRPTSDGYYDRTLRESILGIIARRELAGDSLGDADREPIYVSPRGYIAIRMDGSNLCFKKYGNSDRRCTVFDHQLAIDYGRRY